MPTCKHGDQFPKYCELCKAERAAGIVTPVVARETPAEQVVVSAAPKATTTVPFPFFIQPWGEITQESLDRVRLYQWKYSSNDWWRKRILTVPDFKRAFAKMEEQAEGWTIPAKTAPRDTAAYVAWVPCEKCHGKGQFTVWDPHPSYRLDPRNPLDAAKLLRGEQSLFADGADCTCVKKVTKEEAERLEKSREWNVVPEPFWPLEEIAK